MRLAANNIIFNAEKDEHSLTEELEMVDYFVNNTAEIAFIVGGTKGMHKVRDTVVSRKGEKD